MTNFDSSTLRLSDTVDLIAPSSGFSEAEYERCLTWIKELGLVPRAKPYGELVDANRVFVSNTAEVRFAHLQEALKNSESKAIWCLAGGYGSYQLLSLLDTVPAPVRQKLLIGFSDNTALLSYAMHKWNWPCVYGVTPLQVVRGQVSQAAVEGVKQVVFHGKPSGHMTVRPLNQAAGKSGGFAGKMIGGCLSLMQGLLGTPHCPDVQGKILLLEDDKGETPGRIDRIFDHMLRAGFLSAARAVVLGEFLEDNYPQQEKAFLQAVEMIKPKLDAKNIPLLRLSGVGHTTDMVTVPLGTFVTITLGENPALKFGI